jgi:hypothetical protein
MVSESGSVKLWVADIIILHKSYTIAGLIVELIY